MNISTHLGDDIKGNAISLDLSQKDRRFILLVGATGSGKSIFHNHLYRELSKNNLPSDIKFVFLDMTQVDFMDWKSPYLFLPPVSGDDAMDVLEGLTEPGMNLPKTLFVHIEECDLIVQHPERFKKALKLLLAKEGVHIVFSTSRISREDVLQDWLLDMVDVKIIFKLNSKEDCAFLGTDSSPIHFVAGERLMVYKGKYIKLTPFKDASLSNFKLGNPGIIRTIKKICMIQKTEKYWKILSAIVWILFFVFIALTYYVNHYMPRGPLFSTGDYNCYNDDRGPCEEGYVEDMRSLDIPSWAKFIRKNFIGIFLVLGVSAVYLSAKPEIEKKKTVANNK